MLYQLRRGSRLSHESMRSEPAPARAYPATFQSHWRQTGAGTRIAPANETVGNHGASVRMSVLAYMKSATLPGVVIHTSSRRAEMCARARRSARKRKG